METSHTTALYDRYNVFSEIEMILSPTTDTTGNGRDTTYTTGMCPRMHFILPLLQQQKQQIWQIQQYGNPRYLTVVWVVFVLQGASFTRQKRQIQLYGNRALWQNAQLPDFNPYPTPLPWMPPQSNNNFAYYFVFFVDSNPTTGNSSRGMLQLLWELYPQDLCYILKMAASWWVSMIHKSFTGTSFLPNARIKIPWKNSHWHVLMLFYLNRFKNYFQAQQDFVVLKQFLKLIKP